MHSVRERRSKRGEREKESECRRAGGNITYTTRVTAARGRGTNSKVFSQHEQRQQQRQRQQLGVMCGRSAAAKIKFIHCCLWSQANASQTTADALQSEKMWPLDVMSS